MVNILLDATINCATIFTGTADCRLPFLSNNSRPEANMAFLGVFLIFLQRCVRLFILNINHKRGIWETMEQSERNDFPRALISSIHCHRGSSYELRGALIVWFIFAKLQNIKEFKGHSLTKWTKIDTKLHFLHSFFRRNVTRDFLSITILLF